MSFRTAHPWVYSCNSCEAKAAGDLHELPEGWTEHMTAVKNMSGHWLYNITDHRCPACSRGAEVPKP